MADMYRLIYFSRATDATLSRLGAALHEILDVAIQHNSGVDVTGALLACGGWFVQALEGPRQNVGEVYSRISSDRRHEALQVIRAAPVAARKFSKWSMCGRELSPSDNAIVQVLETKNGFDPAHLSEQSSLRLLAIIAKLQAGANPRTLI